MPMNLKLETTETISLTEKLLLEELKYDPIRNNRKTINKMKRIAKHICC